MGLINDVSKLVGTEFGLYVENVPAAGDDPNFADTGRIRVEALMLDTGDIRLRGADGKQHLTFRPSVYRYVYGNMPSEKTKVTVTEMCLKYGNRIYTNMENVLEDDERTPFTFRSLSLLARFEYKGQELTASAFQNHLLASKPLNIEKVTARIHERPNYASKQSAYHGCLKRILRDKQSKPLFFLGLFDGAIDTTQLIYPMGYTWLALGEKTLVGAQCTELELPKFLDFVYGRGGKVVNINLNDWRG